MVLSRAYYFRKTSGYQNRDINVSKSRRYSPQQKSCRSCRQLLYVTQFFLFPLLLYFIILEFRNMLLSVLSTLPCVLLCSVSCPSSYSFPLFLPLPCSAFSLCLLSLFSDLPYCCFFSNLLSFLFYFLFFYSVSFFIMFYYYLFCSLSVIVHLLPFYTSTFTERSNDTSCSVFLSFFLSFLIPSILSLFFLMLPFCFCFYSFSFSVLFSPLFYILLLFLLLIYYRFFSILTHSFSHFLFSDHFLSSLFCLLLSLILYTISTALFCLSLDCIWGISRPLFLLDSFFSVPTHVV